MPLFLLLALGSTDLTRLTADLSVAPVVHATTTADLIAIATSTANKYGLNEEHFLKVVAKESDGWKVCALGDYKNGEPTSFGLAQLHNPVSDWGVTPEQACDPYIALPIMAQAWVDGKASKWTVWRNLYGKVNSSNDSI